jgi:hypothetical protein
MPLLLDEVFRRIGIAKGDLPASKQDRRIAEEWYRAYLDGLTSGLRQQHPGALSITHQSVQSTVEAAYAEYRRAKIIRATRRRLQGGK